MAGERDGSVEMAGWRHFARSLKSGGGMGAHLDALASRGQKAFGLLDGPEGRGLSVQRGGRYLQKRWAGLLGDADISVYHNGWGVDYLTPLDKAPLRVCWLHSDFPNLPILVRHCAPYVDAFISVHPCMQKRIQSEIPWLPAKRNLLGSCFLPLDPHKLTGMAGPRKELVVGYLGRIEKQQKRIERLIPFCEMVADRGISLRLEVVGGGRSERWLRRKLGRYDFVHFFGEQDKDSIPKILAGWKYILFPSSFEGLPLALLEALAAGVLPIYPDFYDGNDPLAFPAPQGLYPQGEMHEALRALIRLETEYGSIYPQFHRRSLELLEKHKPDFVDRQHRELDAKLRLLRPRQKRQPSALLTLPPVWYYNRIYRYLTMGVIY